jgi:hypothetical protein
MSSTIDFTTVTHSIASLSISGVTVKDVHELSDALKMTDHLLVPRPDNFITGLTVTPAEVSKQNLDVRYTLHYQYFHCAIGGGMNGLFSAYSGLIDKIALIIVAFSKHETLTGAVDNLTLTIDRIGPIPDAAGNAFHGAEMSINILQFLEV